MKDLFGMSDNEFQLFLGGWIILISFIVLRVFIKNYLAKKEEKQFQKTKKKFFNIMHEYEKLKRKNRKK